MSGLLSQGAGQGGGLLTQAQGAGQLGLQGVSAGGQGILDQLLGSGLQDRLAEGAQGAGEGGQGLLSQLLGSTGRLAEGVQGVVVRGIQEAGEGGLQGEGAAGQGLLQGAGAGGQGLLAQLLGSRLQDRLAEEVGSALLNPTVQDRVVEVGEAGGQLTRGVQGGAQSGLLWLTPGCT